MGSQPQWLYDEMIQAGTDYNSYEEVEKYDERMSRFRDFKAEVNEIVDALQLKKDDNLLEIGTGTGEIAIEASMYCNDVYAADISKVMLEYAQKKARTRDRSNIHFIHAGFLQYQHNGKPLNAVVTQIALHHLPDFWKLIALKRINDMLPKGGRLYLKDIVFSLELSKYEKTINYTINNFKDVAGEETANNFIRHIKAEYSTYDWIMEEMLYRAGFYIENADYRDNFMTVYVCSKID